MKRTIDWGNRVEEIEVHYSRKKRTIRISGHYDHIVGIEPLEMDLDAFCKALDIPRSHLKAIVEAY